MDRLDDATRDALRRFASLELLVLVEEQPDRLVFAFRRHVWGPMVAILAIALLQAAFWSWLAHGADLLTWLLATFALALGWSFAWSVTLDRRLEVRGDGLHLHRRQPWRRVDAHVPASAVTAVRVVRPGHRTANRAVAIEVGGRDLVIGASEFGYMRPERAAAVAAQVAVLLGLPAPVRSLEA